MKIAVACDHGGLTLKNAVIAYVEKLGHEVKDFGTYTKDSCDYPDFALAAAEAVASNECQRGIVVCSSGIGVSIVANKVPGIRCAHCHDWYCAKYTRLHNDANMIAFGEKVIGEGMMQEIVTTFLTTEFEGGERHERRLAKIKAIEEKYYKPKMIEQFVSEERVKLKRAKECADAYWGGKWKKNFDSYEKWCQEYYEISSSTAQVYKDVRGYVNDDGTSNLPNKYDKDFTAWQISALVHAFDNREEVIRKACELNLITPYDKPDDIKDKCWEWKMGRTVVFGKTVLVPEEEEKKMEEEFIKKYFRFR